jgi:hypothetical protein
MYFKGSGPRKTEFYTVHFWLNVDACNYTNYLHVNELLLLYGSVSLLFCVQETNLCYGEFMRIFHTRKTATFNP